MFNVWRIKFVRPYQIVEVLVKNYTAFIIHFHTILMISSKSMRFLLYVEFFYICWGDSLT